MKGWGKKVAIAAIVAIVFFALVGWVFLVREAPRSEAGAWGGVDVNVVEKFAADAGREAREPFINTDQGDLLLFVFALAGAVGGFVAGYYWRRLISEKK